jgi:hypothetical protein
MPLTSLTYCVAVTRHVPSCNNIVGPLPVEVLDIGQCLMRNEANHFRLTLTKA